MTSTCGDRVACCDTDYTVTKTYTSILKRIRVFHLLCALTIFWVFFSSVKLLAQSAREYTFSGGRLSVVQEVCAIKLSAPGITAPIAGKTDTITVTASDPYCGWTATVVDNVPWITITGGSSGTGNGTVSYTIAGNADWPRTGAIMIGHQVFTITQGGMACQNECTASLQSCGNEEIACISNCAYLLNLPGCIPGFGGCYEYLSCVEGCDYGCTGSYDLCTESCENACGYALLKTGNDIAAGGGSGGVGVITSGNNCSWTARAYNAWITIPSGSASGKGEGTIGYSVAANTGPARNGTIAIANQTFTVNQGDGCTYTLTSTSTNISSSGGIGSATVTYSNGCAAPTATSNASWIAVAVNSSGNVDYTVAGNIDNNVRNGTITISGKTYTITQTGCTYSISSNGASPTADSGADDVIVTPSSSTCVWAAASNDPSWITVTSGASGAGTGEVEYSFTGNTGTAARTGTITIGGNTYTITQAGCIYTLPTTITNVSADSGTDSANITCTGGSCLWTATSNDSWITVTSGASGAGTGVVKYSFTGNTGTAARTGTITIGGNTYTITQAGCTYSLTSTSTNVLAGGGTGSANITCSGGSCPWTATSNDSWITVTSGASGTGTGAVWYSTASNNGISSRTGTITIGGKIFSIYQAGCTYSLSPNSGSINITGGSGNFTVNPVHNACVWTVSNVPSWVSITGGGGGTGVGQVSYSVGDNSFGPPRNGTITAGGQNFTVWQSGLTCQQICGNQWQACVVNNALPALAACQADCQYIVEDPLCLYAYGPCMDRYDTCMSGCEYYAYAGCEYQYSQCINSCN